MSNTALKNRKADTVKKFGNSATNTGCTEVQVALLTSRINEMNAHFARFPKDLFSRRGLLRMVGQRRRLLRYLRDVSQKRYTQLIKGLELRK